jgi:hypothetical protein
VTMAVQIQKIVSTEPMFNPLALKLVPR